MFDPSIGKERYQEVFSGLMGGRPAYKGTTLNRTQLDLKDAFKLLDDKKVVGRGAYVTIAAHPLLDNGLYRRPADYITDLAGGRIQAAELRRTHTLVEDKADNNKLCFAQDKGGIALYHASDAIGLAAPGAKPADRELGSRFTMIKLASPSLEALRQSLLAHKSRLRDPYRRSADKQLVLDKLPEPCPTGPSARPWLREVTISGGTAFLSGQTFRFSPDLTCIIGGSMTGKSTLLGGLRQSMLGSQDLGTQDRALQRAIEERAQNGFFNGGAQVDLESPAGDVALPVPQRFRMRFYSQSELKSLADDPEGIEHLLFHLVPGRAPALLDQRDRLRELDQQLGSLAASVTAQQERVGDAEQAFLRAQRARTAMERFAQAGTAALPPAQIDVAQTRAFAQIATKRAGDAAALVETLRAIAPSSPRSSSTTSHKHPRWPPCLSKR